MKEYRIRKGYTNPTFYSAIDGMTDYCKDTHAKKRYYEKKRADKWLATCEWKRLQWQAKHGK